MFEIDEKSGEIKVKVPLDRDPPNGRPVWSFNVLATDNGGKNGLNGYAEVQVSCFDWSFNVLATDNGGKNGLDGYAEVQVSRHDWSFNALGSAKWSSCLVFQCLSY